MPDDLSKLQDQYLQFIEERDWGQFHTPQHIAMALSVEANELLECFLWLDNQSAKAVRENAEFTADVEGEIADIVIYILSMANEMEIDLVEAVEEKLEENEERYDLETASDVTDRLQK